jgi:ABC-type transport system involved in multi-copper enzyme maturation permease subunit
MKFRVDRWRAAPNPLWMREMRQSARLVRTPIILLVLTVLITLLMGSIGGVLISGKKSPAEAGSVMFHTFFSLAYFVVTLVGPALAANGIASEREGKTWEAVLLTGMRPEQVARGKFLSAYTAIAMYVVMLAPVGALPFLFGGVTPIEVLVAFVLLFLIALLSVAFGLAVSSKMESLRGALLVTLLAAVPISGFCYSVFGVGGSAAANDLWHTIPEGPPVWLPTAYGRVPFGIEYVVYLIVLPVLAISLPAWLLYEVTRSNLTSITDDRTIGMKRWYVVTTIALTGVAFVPLFATRGTKIADRHIAGMLLYCAFILFSAFLFAGEAIGPSRRVKRLLREKSFVRRFLAPGVVPTARLLLLGSVGPLCLLAIGGIAYLSARGLPRYSSLTADEQIEQIVLFTVYALGFTLFTIGLTSWLRSRASSTATPRVMLLVVMFLLTAGPWVLAAMAGVMSTRGSSAIAVAAPSPVFALYVVGDVVRRGAADKTVPVLALLCAAGAYGALGAFFTLSSARRCQRIVAQHEAMLVEADRRLAVEDAEALERMRAAEQRALEAAELPGGAPPAPAEAADDEPAPEAQRGPSQPDVPAEPRGDEDEAPRAQREPSRAPDAPAERAAEEDEPVES